MEMNLGDAGEPEGVSPWTIALLSGVRPPTHWTYSRGKEMQLMKS